MMSARLQGLDVNTLKTLARSLSDALPARRSHVEADFGRAWPRTFASRTDPLSALVTREADPSGSLREAATSFLALCERLSSKKEGAEVASLSSAEACDEFHARRKLLASVRAVREAANALQSARFPAAQLEAMESRLVADLEAITSAHGERIVLAAGPSVQELFPRAIGAKDVDAIEKTASVLGKLFGRSIEEKVLARASSIDPASSVVFAKNLAAFAILGDTASTALDYAKLPTGWDTLGGERSGPLYPTTRAEYRERRYAKKMVELSRDRQTESRLSLMDALDRALSAEDCAPAVEAALVQGFAREVGIPDAKAATWRSRADAVRDALDKEALIPLRALYAATAHLDHRGVPLHGHSKDALNAACRALVEEIVEHVVEGDFEQWRMTNPASAEQLRSLSPDQLRAFLEPVSIEMTTDSGRTLRTREETGLDLLWFTKVGGPSHGFDMISQCLLPLLANARNGTVLIDDPEWPGTAAGRSYLRLIQTPDGRPTLFLEMVQRDFPYAREPVERRELKMATIQHALAKGKAMGVPVAILLHRAEDSIALLKSLRVAHEIDPEARFVLEPSGGIFEASDSLLEGHHTPQTARMPSKDVAVAIVRPA
jgi:hypothetical protein